MVAIEQIFRCQPLAHVAFLHCFFTLVAVRFSLNDNHAVGTDTFIALNALVFTVCFTCTTSSKTKIRNVHIKHVAHSCSELKLTDHEEDLDVRP